MSRREDFKRILEHRKPERLILDFGGNPLSSMEGQSMNRLLDYLGYSKVHEEPLLFGKSKKIDERILKSN
jgi:uroporphyrinogen decarboxylase